MPNSPTDPRIEDLVRAGKVRIAVFPPEYKKDPSTGELRGWAIDLACALAGRIGVEGKVLEYPGPQPVLDDLKSGACDVAFLTMDPSWPAQVDFSPPLIQFDYTYLITPNSPIRAIADADQPGVCIAVVRNHASTLALSRIKKNAELVSAATPDAAFDLLLSGAAGAFASVRPSLMSYSSKLPGSRVLDDCYGSNVLSMVVPKNHAGWLSYVSEFAEDAKISGLVQRSFDQAGWQGVQVPLPEKRDDV
jgi:polar amino acid transport system substrate-binding protein